MTTVSFTPSGTLMAQVLGQLPAGERVWVIDGGARGCSMPLGRQGAEGHLQIVGFEVDAQECERMNAQARAQRAPHVFHPLCLGRSDGEKRQLTITRRVDCSSLYPPADARLRRWRQSVDTKNYFCTHDHLAAERTVEVQTTTLDAAARRLQIPHVDFLKLDLQGAELDVLQGAEETLSRVLVMQIEVEFSQLYEGQPLFADVDTFVRQRGFTFFNLMFTHAGHFAGRMASPVGACHGKNSFLMPQAAGQLLTADALYMIDPLDSRWPWERRLPLAQYLKLIALAEIYGQLEYAFELLSALRDGIAPVDDVGDRTRWGGIFDAAARHYLTPKAS